MLKLKEIFCTRPIRELVFFYLFFFVPFVLFDSCHNTVQSDMAGPFAWFNLHLRISSFTGQEQGRRQVGLPCFPIHRVRASKARRAVSAISTAKEF